MSECGQVFAFIYGSESPAASIAWHPKEGFFTVFMDDFDPAVDEDGEPVCVHCLIEESDPQLARGLDAAKGVDHVDYDKATDEWTPMGRDE